MSRLLLLFPALWILVLCLGAARSALISQSKISRCDWGDDSEPSSGDGKACKSKFVVSMTLKGGQVIMNTSRNRLWIVANSTIATYSVHERDTIISEESFYTQNNLH